MFQILLTVALQTSISIAGAMPNADASKITKCNANESIGANATVAANVDGDTIHIQASNGNIYSVRMLGIDTPETHYMGQSQGEWGEKAAQRNKELLPVGTKVTLKYGPEECDGHGRVLAFVFKGKININAKMAEEGLAANYCVAPTFQYCPTIGEKAGQALEQRVGMFSDPNVELPYDFRRRISGNEQRSYVGSIKTKIVRTPGNQEAVPMDERVFFYKRSDVKAPYHIEE